MAQIVPTITAENPHLYREQIERVQSFAKRVHIDLMDGTFTPNKSLEVTQLWWPETMQVDVHVMFRKPFEILDELLRLQLRTIIIQAEITDDVVAIINKTKAAGVKIGLSLLPETSVETVAKIITQVDYLLIFSGNLGHQGGSFAKLDLLEKVGKAKALNSQLEMAWDGGIDETNARPLTAAGIEVLNVGGYIHFAKDPFEAYTTLNALVA